MNTVSVPGACCFCICNKLYKYARWGSYIFKDQYSKRMEDVNYCVYLESFEDILMFLQIAAFFVCLISYRHGLYLCTCIMVYNQWEVLCAFRENWNELQYSLHHMKQSSRKQCTWERMAHKPCSHSVKTYLEENDFPTAEQVQ